MYNVFSIRADQVLQGHGTTNTGNLARKCFKDPAKFADALEIDRELIQNIVTILLLFKCKAYIDSNEVENLCLKTYNMHYNLYPWARMSPTVHKLLMHGCQIARKFPLPIAYFAEDAGESWHKYYRKNMIMHARQTSKANRLQDVFDRAIYLTDPMTSLISERSTKNEIIKLPTSLQKYHQDWLVK